MKPAPCTSANMALARIDMSKYLPLTPVELPVLLSNQCRWFWAYCRLPGNNPGSHFDSLSANRPCDLEFRDDAQKVG